MTWANYDDVERQLIDAGLILRGPVEVGTHRPVRCRVEGGDREKRGWYWLSDILLDRNHPDGSTSKELFIVGSFGIYRGNDSGKTKVELPKAEAKRLTPEQRAAIKTRHEENARMVAAARKAEADRAAQRAMQIWSKCAPEGESEYLARKLIGAYGVRFTPQGALAVPMQDATGKIHGLQFILDRKKHAARIKRTGRDKEYWPAGLAKQGHYHLVGGMPSGALLIAEGYATAASLHMATRLPVAVAFDAGNLQSVAVALHKRYPRARILICADDDYRTEGNPGIAAASAAALAVGGDWIKPIFSADRPTDRKGPTDFNDLHVAEGLALVLSQVEAKLAALNWRAEESARAEGAKQGGGESKPLAPIETVEELLDRFALVYGHRQTVFDYKERLLLGLSDMRDACTHRELHRRWSENPAKKIVRIKEVGFDPAGTDKGLKCNLWGGWPTQPRSGSCENLLDLLRYLCATEKNADDVSEWVLKWLAYPIQNPGAKMKTALVFHGPQGVGKNLFFESVMAIYGEYGRIVDQHAIEDKFNDWASKKLFLIADEVVTRNELYHTKNKLKAYITGEWIRINPKNVAAYEERNHVNFVFLSNETQPLILERDDRRHSVVWTPAKLPASVYADVRAEIKAGGVAALHHYLLHLDLGDFRPWTEPPMTDAKRELIELGMDSGERFLKQWTTNKLEGVPYAPCKSEQLYDLYRLYCARNGIRSTSPSHHFLATVERRTDAAKVVGRYVNGIGVRQARFIVPLGQEPPPEKSQSIWLGECVVEFDRCIADWKEERGGQFSD